jgi:hypothetical protein
MFVNNIKVPWSSKPVVYKDTLFTSQRELSASIRKNIRTCIICKICVFNSEGRIKNFTTETQLLVSFVLFVCMWLPKMLLLRFYVTSNIQKYLVLPESAPYLFQILATFRFSRQIFYKRPVPNFIKICPVGANLIYEDRQTDGQK